jgi:hypothetical protein
METLPSVFLGGATTFFLRVCNSRAIPPGMNTPRDFLLESLPLPAIQAFADSALRVAVTSVISEGSKLTHEDLPRLTAECMKHFQDRNWGGLFKSSCQLQGLLQLLEYGALEKTE